ncbi:MAG TPA: hypothetical protein VGC42_08885, partial [Kofleriaceae bacterium]
TAIAPALPATAPGLPGTAAPPLVLGADPLSGTAGTTGPAAGVRDYFARMQAIQTVGPSGDTGELANKILASSISGDTSGLDELARAAEAGAQRAAAITPPPELAAYHQRLLSMLGEGAGMVRQIKTALHSNDASALGALAGTGSALQTRATALEDEARQIKARYGLR